MLRALRYWLIVIPLMFKHSLGRWYVFRDCPKWVLEELAEVAKHDDEACPDTSSFLREATDELTRRNQWKR